MIDRGKHSILGLEISAVDYEQTVADIVRHAREGKPFAVSALAVHGVMTGVLDEVHQRRLNGLDRLVPDGQPVRWALRLRHGVKLPDRVYGPNLTLYTAAAAAEHDLPVYLYGSTAETLDRFERNLVERFPGLRIAGKEPSKFRRLTTDEKAETAARIRGSGAKLVFVGLGCPRQEVWAFEYRKLLSMPILAVGAAFDFHAGTLKQAPSWMQARGLEWLYRLIQEPKRLWRRYAILNPLYVLHVTGEVAGLRRRRIVRPDYTEREESYG